MPNFYEEMMKQKMEERREREAIFTSPQYTWMLHSIKEILSAPHCLAKYFKNLDKDVFIGHFERVSDIFKESRI